MQIVRARFDLEVRDRRLTAVILGRNRAGLQLEFADGLSRRTELIVVAARKIGPADRNSIDQNLVRILLSAVDGARE